MIFPGVEHIVNPSQADTTIVYLLAAILGGGAITGVVNWFRLRKTGTAEKEEIISKAAEQAVAALQSSLTRLEVELEQAKRERDKIEQSLKDTITERVKLEERVKMLSERILELEKSVATYRSILEQDDPNFRDKLG